MKGSRISAQAADSSRVLELDGVSFDYGRAGDGFQLQIESLSIHAAESIACIGPSGSGKSTFLALAAGIELAQRGQVQTLGKAWNQLSDADRRRLRISRIGLVFQEFALFDHLTVRENILLPYFVNPTLSLDREAELRASQLAETAGIQAYLQKKPRHLSQGERQRVALCRALVTQPALILADEPTGNLDPDTSRSVVNLMQRERTERGATLVVVTHDHEMLDSFDRVIDFANYSSRRSVSASKAGGAA
ncbi:MAG: putative ABC transport system ATP-binding protein [Planctomycetota bacterium]|jgi:putative ABC transport system ATP-binding protein